MSLEMLYPKFLWRRETQSMNDTSKMDTNISVVSVSQLSFTGNDTSTAITTKNRSQSIRQNLKLNLTGKHPINYRYSSNSIRMFDISTRLNPPQAFARKPPNYRIAELRRIKKDLLARSRRWVPKPPRVPKTIEPIKGPNPQQMSTLKSYLDMPPQIALGEAFKVELRVEELHRLSRNKWLNDNIIDAYLSSLTESTDSFAFTTHFYSKLESDGPQGVKRWAIRKKLNVLDKSKIFIPVNRGNMHWCLAVIDNKHKKFSYYDSLHGGGEDVVKNLEKYMNFETNRLQPDQKDANAALFSSYTKEPSAECPTQENGIDCGVFVCQNTAELMKGEKINYTQQDIPNVRNNIAYTLLSLTKGFKN